VAALALGGCLRQVVDREPVPTPTPAPLTFLKRGITLDALGIRKLAVIEAQDRTDSGGGLPAAQALLDEIKATGLDVHPVVLRRQGTGVAPSWLAAQRRLTGADAFVTASLSAFEVQPDLGRTFVAMTTTLLEPSGRIIWSRRLSAQAPLTGLQAALPNEGQGNNGAAVPPPLPLPLFDRAGVERDSLAVAAQLAAKEFAHDLAPDSPR
jgi:hypothetical protein